MSSVGAADLHIRGTTIGVRRTLEMCKSRHRSSHARRVRTSSERPWLRPTHHRDLSRRIELADRAEQIGRPHRRPGSEEHAVTGSRPRLSQRRSSSLTGFPTDHSAPSGRRSSHSFNGVCTNSARPRSRRLKQFEHSHFPASPASSFPVPSFFLYLDRVRRRPSRPSSSCCGPSLRWTI